MNGERLRMRPWLEKQINGGRIPGLQWVDKARGIFKVPWKHAGKPGFVLERDALIFKEWAKHTGKYKDGEQADPSTWKTRFRCALHKLPDIEEVKEQSNLDGEDPYRMFRFLPKGSKMELPTDPDLAPSPVFTDISVSPASTIDMNHEERSFFDVHHMPENGDNEFVDQLQAAIIDDYSVGDDYSEWNDNSFGPMNFSCSLDTNDYLNGFSTEADFPVLQDQAEAAVIPTSAEINDMIGINPQEMKVGIKMFYRDNQVSETIVGNQYGCRVFSGVDVTRIPVYNDNLAQLYGPAEVEQIRFPDGGSPTAIMEKLNRGLLLQWHQNSILATRFCQAHVYASGGYLGSNILALDRNKPTLVFDCNYFLTGLADYKLSKAPVPLYEVFFSFGQKPATATTVDPGVLITVAVTHMTAKASISMMGSASDVIMSIEDDGDILARQIQQVVKIQ